MRSITGIFLAMTLIGLNGCGDPIDADPAESSLGESAEALAASVLDTTIPQQQRREAASRLVALTQPDAAIPAMQTALATSDDELVREMMARRLGELRDMDSSPILIEAMNDSSQRVREAAALSVLMMLGRDFFYRADDPPERRQAVVQIYRRYWEDIQKSPAAHEVMRERNQQLRREREATLRPGQK